MLANAMRLLQVTLVMGTDRFCLVCSISHRGVSAVRKINLVGATFLALSAGAFSFGAFAQTNAAPAAAPEAAAPATPAPDSSAPADTAAPAKKKPMHHKMMHASKEMPTKAGDAAVEDLNDASLNAAKSGKPFAAPTKMPTAMKASAHTTAKKPMHHKMMKKAAAPADAATPPADSSK
jgi:hypothetical protein